MDSSVTGNVLVLESAAIRKMVDLIVASAQVEDKDESEQISAADTMKAVEEAASALEDTDAKDSEEE